MKKKMLAFVLSVTSLLAVSGMSACFRSSDSSSISSSQESSIIDKYTITFDSNGGNVVGAMEVEGNDYRLPVPVRDGYTFDGWTLNGETFTVQELTENITLVASWTKIQTEFLLEFGDGIAAITVKTGEKIGALPIVPAKDGYTNDGKWYIEGEEITADTIWNFAENKYAVANYIADTNIPYTVKYYKQTGYDSYEEVAEDAETYQGATGTKTNFALDSENPKTYEGYIFSNIEQAVIKADGSTIVKVYFKKASLKITLVLNNGQENIEAQDVPCYITAEILNAQVDTPKREGYTFNGWTLNGVAFKDEMRLEADATLEASWEANKYLLSFPEGIKDVEVYYGQAIGELPTPTGAEVGYEGVWLLDGVALTPETVWNKTMNRTVEVVYYEITNSIGSDVWTGAGVLKENYHELGTYYIGGRKFYGEKAVSEAPAWIEVGFAISEEAVTYIRSQAPAGTNALKLNVYFCGDSSTEPNAVTHVGYASNNGVTAGTVAPQVWGETTVSFSMIDTLGWTAFWYSVYGVTETANGTVYGYYEYVTVGETGPSTNLKLTLGDAQKDVIKGEAIGELPTVPTRDGYEGFWTIDGTVITAETVWSYEEDKTAEAVYYEIMNSIGSVITTMDYKPEYSVYGTYTVAGRIFGGFYRTTAEGRQGYVDFGLVNATKTTIDAIVANAPEGYNALRMWVYYIGDAPNGDEANAITKIGGAGDGHPNAVAASDVAAKTWGSQTVAFSLITATDTGYDDFGWSFYAYTESWDASVYYYFEYVSI